jgi:hypothetical protein
MIRRRNLLARIATALVGFLLFLYGLIAAFSPLPLGAPLVIIGLFMIAAAVPAFRPFIRALRRRWRWFDKLVRLVAAKGPRDVKDVAEETEPNPPKDNSDAEIKR